jgi:thioredoxin-like negative regulator of GroEL
MPFLEELEAESDGGDPTDQAKEARAERLATQANALIQQADWEEAAEALATAVQLAAQPPAAWHVNLANCLCELR